MIRCTLELLPGGIDDPERIELLGVIEIHNLLGTSIESDGKRGDYGYELQKKRKGRVVALGRVNNFPRLSYHPWNLVKWVLADVAAKNGGPI